MIDVGVTDKFQKRGHAFLPVTGAKTDDEPADTLYPVGVPMDVMAKWFWRVRYWTANVNLNFSGTVVSDSFQLFNVSRECEIDGTIITPSQFLTSESQLPKMLQGLSHVAQVDRSPSPDIAREIAIGIQFYCAQPVAPELFFPTPFFTQSLYYGDFQFQHQTTEPSPTGFPAVNIWGYITWDEGSEVIADFGNNWVTDPNDLITVVVDGYPVSCFAVTSLPASGTIEITPSLYWEYRDANNSNPIWNAITGAKIRNPLNP